MSFLRMKWLFQIIMIISVVGLFAIAANAAVTVTLSAPSPGPSPTPNPGPTTMVASTGTFPVKADVAGYGSDSVTKVVFYRNDVPLATDSAYPYEISQTALGQDTYTYRARAYISNGTWVDSADWILTVTTPMVFVMGGNNSSLPGKKPGTTGPSSTYDHTPDIEAALAYLSGYGGGTLLFPCKIPGGGATTAIYNISYTVRIPSNITLQGEGAEIDGKCGIYWRDVSVTGSSCYAISSTLKDKPMFQITGGTSRVRFKDLALHSKAHGIACIPYDTTENPDVSTTIEDDEIEADNISAIEFNTDVPGRTGDISDVVIENVSIAFFTNGIKAVSGNIFARKITNIKMRGYRPAANHRQLFIDAPYAYDWDLQNVNFSSMMKNQGGVEIVNAGRPSEFSGENGGLKFLQLSCDGGLDREHYPPAFCVQVQKHSGLYFRQLHFEGVDNAINVKDISGRSADNTNSDPIVIETSLLAGIFEDASMQLYLIGNNIYGSPPNESDFKWDDGRMDFIGNGIHANLYDCGDFFTDITDVPPLNSTSLNPQMLFTHSERNRANFNAQIGGGPLYPKSHTTCPANISEYGGRFFDSGVLPTESGTYTAQLLTTGSQSTLCPSMGVEECIESLATKGGTVFLSGPLTVNRAIEVPRGTQIIGAPSATLTLNTSNRAIFRITASPVTSTYPGMSGVVLRNLSLTTSPSRAGTIGIDISGPDGSATTGVSRDLHFSGLSIDGFKKGIYVHASSLYPDWHPMVNGVSMKNMAFTSNEKAFDLRSANASNWNIMNLSMKSTSSTAVGWQQYYGGHFGLQGVRCEGVSEAMSDCFYVQMAGTGFLNGLKKTVNVTNAFTLGPGAKGFSGQYFAYQSSVMTFRNNDFSGGTFNVLGKSIITSMNNKYDSVNVDNVTPNVDEFSEADVSRLTYCADSYTESKYFSELEDDHQNIWFGSRTPTRLECGSPANPWDEPISLGGVENDQPLTGNLYDDSQEDLIIFRPGSSARFLIKKHDGSEEKPLNWGTTDDQGLIGNFHPGSRAEAVVYRKSTGYWWVWDFTTSNYYAWYWGLPCSPPTNCDRPLIGNFFNEASYGSVPVTGDKDEIGIYRPGTTGGTFWVQNPRSTGYKALTTTADNDSVIKVGDFLGLGYDQIAQYKNGVWKIADVNTGTTTTVYLGTTGDIPVPGHYLPKQSSSHQECTQLGVWRPSTRELLIRDAAAACGTRTEITYNMVWGSLNNYTYQQAGVWPVTYITDNGPDDILLPIKGADGLDRPAAYRPYNDLFPYSSVNGQWWVHNKF